MKLQLQQGANISAILIILLCAIGGPFMNQENHEKMSLIHEEKIQLVQNNTPDVGKKQEEEMA